MIDWALSRNIWLWSWVVIAGVSLYLFGANCVTLDMTIDGSVLYHYRMAQSCMNLGLVIIVPFCIPIPFLPGVIWVYAAVTFLNSIGNYFRFEKINLIPALQFSSVWFLVSSMFLRTLSVIPRMTPLTVEQTNRVIMGIDSELPHQSIKVLILTPAMQALASPFGLWILLVYSLIYSIAIYLTLTILYALFNRLFRSGKERQERCPN